VGYQLLINNKVRTVQTRIHLKELFTLLGVKISLNRTLRRIDKFYIKFSHTSSQQKVLLNQLNKKLVKISIHVDTCFQCNLTITNDFILDKCNITLGMTSSPYCIALYSIV